MRELALLRKHVYRVLPTMVSSGTKNELFLKLAITDKFQPMENTVYQYSVCYQSFERRARNWSTIHIRDYWKYTASSTLCLAKLIRKWSMADYYFKCCVVNTVQSAVCVNIRPVPRHNPGLCRF